MQPTTIFTKNDFHLGDNLVFLHLLRAIAKTDPARIFVHFCHECHRGQLREVVRDIPNIVLEPMTSAIFAQHIPGAINTWKNHEDTWVNSPLRWDWSAYTLWHHGVIARQMGYESPFTCREQLLFDYPKLQEGPWTNYGYDFLILNSEPCSGQFGPMRKHGSGYLDDLIIALVRAGKKVVVTQPTRDFEYEGDGIGFVLSGPDQCSITQIGNISLKCTHHIMIATGPMWPTLNTTNHHTHEGRRRIVLLDNGEQLNMPHIEQVATVEDVFEISRREGWL